MLIDNRDLAVAAPDEVGNQVHRAGAIERHQRGDVLDGRNLELAAQVAHPPGLKLEHANGVPLVQEFIGGRVIERKVVDGNVDPVDFLHHFAHVADDGQRLQPEKVHLEQAEIADRIHRVLRDDRAILVGLERKQIDQRLVANDDTGGVDGAIAGDVLKDEGDIDQFARGRFGLVSLPEVGGLFEGLFERHLQLEGDHLRQPITLGVAQAHDAADVAHDGLGAHCAERDDLRHAIAAVFVADVFDHVRAAVVGEVDVDVGRVDALGIEEPFEEQVVADGINIGDFQEVGDERASRAATRHARDALAPPVAHKIGHDQEIRDEPGFFDDRQLGMEAVEDDADCGGDGRALVQRYVWSDSFPLTPALSLKERETGRAAA